jgi:hypothetical protein
MSFSEGEWADFLEEIVRSSSQIWPFINKDPHSSKTHQNVSIDSYTLSQGSQSFRLPPKISREILCFPFLDAIETADKLSTGELELRDPGPDTFLKVGKSIELHFRYIWCGDEIEAFESFDFTLSKVVHQIRKFMLHHTDNPSYEYHNPSKNTMIKVHPIGSKHGIFLQHKNKSTFFSMCDAYRKINRLRNRCAHRSPKSWKEIEPYWDEVCDEMYNFTKCFDTIYG